MSRLALSFRTVGPVLAVLFALAAITLVLTSRTQLPPPLSQLTIVEGRVQSPTSGLMGGRLHITVGGVERTFDARGCESGLAELNPGDPVVAWVDGSGRAWRLMRRTTPLCTYLQAAGSDDNARRSRRATALVFAVAGVVCGGVSLSGRVRRG